MLHDRYFVFNDSWLRNTEPATLQPTSKLGKKKQKKLICDCTKDGECKGIKKGNFNLWGFPRG